MARVRNDTENPSSKNNLQEPSSTGGTKMAETDLLRK